MLHVIYHANCNDGFGAAWATYKYWGYNPEEVRYYPLQYGDNIPAGMKAEDKVAIFDFSFDREVMEHLYEAHEGKVVLWDHHATAKLALEDLPYCHFDMEHSGAVLAWQHWFGNLPVPGLLQYVEDRDLWKFELAESRAHSAALQLAPHDFTAWDMYAKDPGNELLLGRGRTLLQAQEAQLDRLAQHAVRGMLVEGHRVMAVNTALLQSELGERLLALYDDVDVAALWYVASNGQYHWSLRSRKGGVHVGEWAKEMGGGGHQAAAGFVTWDEWQLVIHV